MSLKTFLMKKMLKSKMQGMPEEQQDKIFTAIDKNPELFQKIAAEVQEKVKSGQSEMQAAMDVMKKYQSELKGLM